MAIDIKKCLKEIADRGYETAFVSTASEAAELVLAEGANASSVGWGGSETIKALGVREKFVNAGKEIRDHQTTCDLFLLSANAVTSDGRIVNIDGNGNRISASIFGPKRVVYVIGRNKFVEGGVDEAIARIKRFACPPNARRLNRNTPCGITGKCGNCNSPDRMCKVVAIFERCPTNTPTKVIVVDEELGY